MKIKEDIYLLHLARINSFLCLFSRRDIETIFSTSTHFSRRCSRKYLKYWFCWNAGFDYYQQTVWIWFEMLPYFGWALWTSLLGGRWGTKLRLQFTIVAYYRAKSENSKIEYLRPFYKVSYKSILPKKMWNTWYSFSTFQNDLRIDHDVLERSIRYMSFEDMQYYYLCFLFNRNGIVTDSIM